MSDLRRQPDVPSWPRRRRRLLRAGMTIVEVLVALVIASVFLIGIVGAVSAILDAAEKAERRGEAVRHARTGLNHLSDDLSQVATVAQPLITFVGIDGPLPAGDLFDGDGDGFLDEESPDGANDDAGPVTQQHALLGVSGPLNVLERPRMDTVEELGDLGVDEDVRFQNDTLSFFTALESVTYRVGTFDGRDNVLLRVTVDLLTPGAPEVILPVAFDVLSFELLYFDPNWLLLGRPNPWVTSWTSLAPPGPIPFPPTVFASITVYAGEVPLVEVPPGQRLTNVTLETQIVLESALTLYHAQF